MDQVRYTSGTVSRRVKDLTRVKPVALHERGGTAFAIVPGPGFIPHTVNTVTEMAEYFVAQEAPRAAMFVAVAASLGPYPADICSRFQALALKLQSIAA